MAETEQSLGAEQQSPQSTAAWSFILFILPASSTTFPDLTPQWEGPETALTLGLPSSDHWGKTLGGLTLCCRGKACVLCKWTWPTVDATSKQGGVGGGCSLEGRSTMLLCALSAVQTPFTPWGHLSDLPSRLHHEMKVCLPST